MMNGRVKRVIRLLLLTLLPVWLAGCASPSQPSRFYRLDSVLPPMAMPQPVMSGQNLPIIGVGPVELASYLDRPQIVERTTPHRLQLYEFDRWAGTLQENALQVVSEVMQQALGRAQVVSYPWHSSVRPDYELVLTINRFERQGEKVRLESRWTLVAQPQGRLVKLGRQPFEAPVDGSDMEATVAAASAALEQLGRVLAEELAPLLTPID
ncbi:MAG: PqiC family protein [Candidatus Thiodiazotropha sp.]